MSTVRPDPCPLCDAEPISATPLTDKDAYEVECRRCGKFSISGSLYSSHDIPKASRPWLSAYTRQCYERGQLTEMIISSNIQALSQELEKMSPRDRANKLLQILIKRTSYMGAPVEFSPQWDYPLATAQNSQEAMFHLGELKSKGLIRLHDMNHLLVTHDGWDYGKPASTPSVSTFNNKVEPPKAQKQWDVFICHASEDKDTIVDPLAIELEKQGLRVWLDRTALSIGDSLRRKIDEGLGNSRFGVVVLSPDFFTKSWTQRELDGLVQRELCEGKVILPVWHNVTQADVLCYSAPLADKLAISTNHGISRLVKEILQAVQPSFDVEKNTPIPTRPDSDTAGKTSSPDSARVRIRLPKQVDLPSMGQESSTTFFSSRFAKAFPGTRGIQWFRNPAEAIKRLQILFAEHFVFRDAQPIWWWRSGELQIKVFSTLSDDTVLFDHQEITLEELAAVNASSYYQEFVYIKAKPSPPSGLYDLSHVPDELALKGYAREEFALFRGRPITRAEFDDGAAVIDGDVVNLNGEAFLRERYLTPYNLIIAPQESPINNKQFDGARNEMLNRILRGEATVEELTDAILKLPRREYYNRH